MTSKTKNVSTDLNVDRVTVCTVTDNNIVERLRFYAFRRHITYRGKLSLSRAAAKILDDALPDSKVPAPRELVPVVQSFPSRRDERLSAFVPVSMLPRIEAEQRRRGIESRSHLLHLILSEGLRDEPSKGEAHQVGQIANPFKPRNRVSKKGTK